MADLPAGSADYLASPAEFAGTTSDGVQWSAAIAVPVSSVTFESAMPLPCPTLSLSGGAVLAWTPTTDARIHAVRIDGSVDGGAMMRIACVANEDAGMLDVPGSVLGQFAGASTVDIVAYDVASLLIDAGDTPIEIRAATSVSNPYNAADHLGLCTISP
jgi:hypothetical protein